MFSVKETIADLNLHCTVTRKQISLFGWHCLTYYKYMYSRGEEKNIHQWIYFGENKGFGIHI